MQLWRYQHDRGIDTQLDLLEDCSKLWWFEGRTSWYKLKRLVWGQVEQVLLVLKQYLTGNTVFSSCIERMKSMSALNMLKAEHLLSLHQTNVTWKNFDELSDIATVWPSNVATVPYMLGVARWKNPPDFPVSLSRFWSIFFIFFDFLYFPRFVLFFPCQVVTLLPFFLPYWLCHWFDQHLGIVQLITMKNMPQHESCY